MTKGGKHSGRSYTKKKLDSLVRSGSAKELLGFVDRCRLRLIVEGSIPTTWTTALLQIATNTIIETDGGLMDERIKFWWCERERCIALEVELERTRNSKSRLPKICENVEKTLLRHRISLSAKRISDIYYWFDRTDLREGVIDKIDKGIDIDNACFISDIPKKPKQKSD